jgi:tRNA uracil 4-sulfurtransferase
MVKVVALLSGGIDSPVAIHLMSKHFEIVAVHAHQEELTGPKEIEKVKSLAKKLEVKVYFLPFTKIFQSLVQNCNHRDYYILSKIAMFKAAELIAIQEGAKYLVTGENLAQVSSQTLTNMESIDQNVSMTILRPLLTWDKQEIVNMSKEIKTFVISKGPEVCSLLGPKNPSTRSSTLKIRAELDKVNYKALIEESIESGSVYN